MTRKFAWWGLSFLTGLVLFCADMGESLLIFAAAVIAAAALVFAALKKYRVYVLSVVVCVLLGLFCGKIYTCFNFEKAADLDGKNVTLDGYITDFSYIGSDSCRVTVKGKIDGVSAKISYFADHDDFQYYEKVKVTGKVKLIEDTLDFQSAQYYYPKRVFLQGGSDVVITKTGCCENSFMRAVLEYRDYTAQCLTSALEKEQSGFLKALLCGDKSDVDSVTKTTLYRSGIGHMFAVSGTHLTAVAMFASLIFGAVFKSLRVRFALTEAVILAFIAFAGFSPSVVRAGIMLSAVYCSNVFRRRADCLNSLGICCVVMGALNPYVVKDPAFILSFAAAFAVGVVYPKLAELTDKTALRFVVMTVVILFVTMPFATAFFSETSIISPVSNLIMMPLCTLALVICFTAMLFGGTCAVSQALFRLSGMLSSAVIKCADFFSDFEFAAIPARYMYILIAFAAFAWLGIFLAVRSGRLRVFIISAAAVYAGLFCSVAFVRMADRDRLHIIILPQDKSCAAVVYQNGSAEILDINSKGSAYYPLQRALSSRGVTRLNAVMIKSGYYYSANIYKNEIFPESAGFFSESDGENAFSSAEFGSAVIESSGDGYTVSYDGQSVYIGEDNFAAGENVYDMTDQDCPFEIVLDGEKMAVRRLDYAFD